MRIRHRLLHSAMLAACVAPASLAIAMPAAASVAPPPTTHERPALPIPPGLDKWFPNPHEGPTLHIPERPNLNIPVLTVGLPPQS